MEWRPGPVLHITLLHGHELAQDIGPKRNIQQLYSHSLGYNKESRYILRNNEMK